MPNGSPGLPEVWASPPSVFNEMVGDLLVANQYNGDLYKVHWNGSSYETAQVAHQQSTYPHWDTIAFAPPLAQAAALAQIPLMGTVTDDGLPLNVPLLKYWTDVSGPGSVSFGDRANPTTQAFFDSPGTYVLRLTADDSQYTSSDDVTIT